MDLPWTFSGEDVPKRGDSKRGNMFAPGSSSCTKAPEFAALRGSGRGVGVEERAKRLESIKELDAVPGGFGAWAGLGVGWGVGLLGARVIRVWEFIKLPIGWDGRKRG